MSRRAELDWRARLCRKLKDLDARPMEAKFVKGVPDVNYIEGWMELKKMAEWPVRGGVLAIDHFTQEQRLWLHKRWRRGGRAFLFLNVAREFLLFAGCDAPLVGFLTREELYSIALLAMQQNDIPRLKAFLTMGRDQLDERRKNYGICTAISSLRQRSSLSIAAGMAGTSTKRHRSMVSATTRMCIGSED